MYRSLSSPLRRPHLLITIASAGCGGSWPRRARSKVSSVLVPAAATSGAGAAPSLPPSLGLLLVSAFLVSGPFDVSASLLASFRFPVLELIGPAFSFSTRWRTFWLCPFRPVLKYIREYHLLQKHYTAVRLPGHHLNRLRSSYLGCGS